MLTLPLPSEKPRLSAPQRFQVRLEPHLAKTQAQPISAPTRPVEDKPAGRDRRTLPARLKAPPNAAEPVAMTPSNDLNHRSPINLEDVFRQARGVATQLPEPSGRETVARPLSAPPPGRYGGVFEGGDRGAFSVSLTADGRIFGSAHSNRYGSFPVSGTAHLNGRIFISGQGMAGGARFTGQWDPAAQRVNGTWTFPALGTGTFFGVPERDGP